MKRFLITLSCIFLFSCNGGLEPVIPVEPGFGGTIYFAPGSWPPADSLVSVWLFASQIYPLDSTTVFSGILSSPPQIFLYPAISQSLPFNVDSVEYRIDVPVGTYKYIGILHQFNTVLNIHSFHVVSFLPDSLHPSSPRILEIHDGEYVGNIDLHVDFRSLPPQPF